eukprot:jgi/Bigna1/77507/fgenesh1_pg.48_\
MFVRPTVVLLTFRRSFVVFASTVIVDLFHVAMTVNPPLEYPPSSQEKRINQETPCSGRRVQNSRTSGKWCPLRERKVDLIDISPLAKSGQYQPLKKRSSVSSKRREDSIREEEDSIDPSEHQQPETRTDRQTRSTTHAEKANTAKPIGLTTDTSKEHSHESSGAMDTTIPKQVTSTSAAPESETAPKIPVKEEEKAKSSETNSDARQIGHSSSTSGPSETEEAKILCKAQKHDSGRKANPSSGSIRSNIFTDSNNWVDEDAVFAWKVLVVHALHQRKEEVSCYSNSTIKELKEAYIFSMKGSHNTNLFKLQKGIYYLLPEHWTLHPMVRNRSTVYA